jgi:hypothetical protein
MDVTEKTQLGAEGTLLLVEQVVNPSAFALRMDK